MRKKNNRLQRHFSVPLYQKILAGMLVGLLLGYFLGPKAAVFGELGTLVIRVLKALATPLIFFAVVDAFLKTEITGRKGLTLLGLSFTNAVVALALGLALAQSLHAGDRWQGRPELASVSASTGAVTKPAEEKPTLDFVQNLKGFIPDNLVEPFFKNAVVSVILAALFLGAALRKIRSSGSDTSLVERLVETALAALKQILEWSLNLVPFAVGGVVAKVFGASGASVFGLLGLFLAVILTGLFLQAGVYYSLLLWLVGRTHPTRFWRGALDSVVTALGCGSSLATLPVTLKCLREKLGVSEGSSRLAACVATNLNHDGIILYEMAATLFIAQAFGVHLSGGALVGIAAASVMAGIGISGIPDAGLVTLPLVLGAAGLPENAAALAVPLLLPVDWIIGRCRAAVNVSSDMTVAVLLDRFHPQKGQE